MGTPRLNLSKFTKAKPASESPDLRTLAAALVRGASGFAPGGLIGAGAGVIGEGLAQTIEPREDYNIAQMLTQGGLGLIPFGKAGGIARGMFKGGLMAGGGNIATSQAEEGLHIPTGEELKSAGIATGVGALAGGLRLEKFIGKGKTPKAAKVAETVVEDVPPIKIDLSKRDIKTKGPKPKDIRSGPMIMSEGGPSEGRKIMEGILAESAGNKPTIPIKGLPAPTEIPKTPKGSTVVSWLNAPKTIAASSDLSAPLRQGIFLIGRKAWWNAWKPMIQSLREGNYNEINKAIASHPKFTEGTEHGLAITSPDKLEKMEEQFASQIAEKIPLVGKYLIKPSERAYTTFLNKLRMDLYSDLVDKADKLRAPIDKAKLAQYINSATGRGSMGLTVGGSSKTLEAAAPFLNTTFFSPRFIASRVQLLNPVSYAKMDPFTRKEAMRDLATLTTVAGTALTLAKMSGADVSLDPTDADFGKIKVGDTRVDMLGGFGQYIRFFSQTAKGLATDEPGPDPKRFIESKLSPTAAMLKEMISKKDYFGRETSIPQSVANNVSPMIVRDIYDLWKENPDLVPLAGLSLFGLSTQTYGEQGIKGTSTGVPRIRLKIKGVK